ncbi:hypothetical protein KZO25_13845 [Halomonas sp. ANAO-440]|nr:hypothetical protein [Halomonas sp. ANAO-440]
MKRVLEALLVFLLFLPSLAYSATLLTPNYRVEIEHKCEEGVVACDDVTYFGTSNTSGNSLKIKGSTWHAACADGVSPCRFLGYVFENEGVVYRVYESGMLTVTKESGEILVEEQGEWEY